MLGNIYMNIREELILKKRNEIDINKKNQNDQNIMSIIMLTMVLRNMMLNQYNDLSEFADQTFDELEDNFSENISNLTIPRSVLLQQFKDGTLSNFTLIENIIKILTILYIMFELIIVINIKILYFMNVVELLSILFYVHKLKNCIVISHLNKLKVNCKTNLIKYHYLVHHKPVVVTI